MRMSEGRFWLNMIDDFERGNLTPYFGDTAGFSISTEQPRGRGGYSCKSVITSSTNTYHMIATTGLNANFPRGYKARCYVYMHNDFDLVNSNLGLIFGAQDANNNFIFRFNPASEYVRLIRRSGGSNTQLVTETVSRSSFVKGEWAFIEIAWATNGDITATYYRANGAIVESISANSTSHASNTGIGFFSNSNITGTASRRAYFDDYMLIRAL
jgi:hypothetical protein